MPRHLPSRILEAPRFPGNHPLMMRPFRDYDRRAIVFCHYNPAGFDAPRVNMERFMTDLRMLDLPAVAVEIQPPGVPFALPECPHVRRITTEDQLFYKETAWNLAVRMLPPQIEEILFLDADVIFENPEQVMDGFAMLDEYDVIQPFSEAIFLDQAGVERKIKISSGWAMMKGVPGAENPMIRHTGFALCMRRRTFAALGGLYLSPTGGGDLLAVGAFIGNIGVACGYIGQISEEYVAHYRKWAENAMAATRRGLGAARGRIYHLWHGDVVNREYETRGLILKGLDPDRHLAESPDGILTWTPEARALGYHDRLAEYFIRRQEGLTFDQAA